jgi:hypothetical protein
MISLVFIVDVPGSIPDRCRAICVSLLRRGNAVGTTTRLLAGCPKLDQEIYVFSRMFIRAVGSTEPPVQWVLGALFSGENWPECETDDSSLSTAGVHNEWSYTYISPYTFMACTETTVFILPFRFI